MTHWENKPLFFGHIKSVKITQPKKTFPNNTDYHTLEAINPNCLCIKPKQSNMKWAIIRLSQASLNFVELCKLKNHKDKKSKGKGTSAGSRFCADFLCAELCFVLYVEPLRHTLERNAFFAPK
jgi:hypothetical protein